tara:strand:+ start:172 stop:2406 length:2235 start_codon:yes stop_codon:yes gene_type:complete
MPSVLIDRKTKKIIGIVEGQKLKNTNDYKVFYTNKVNESEILKELSSLGILGETVFFDVVFKRDALGDVLMLMPVIVGLKKSYPYLKIALQTDEWLVPLFGNDPIFDSVVDFHTNVNGHYEINLCKIENFIESRDGRENQHRTLYYEDKTKEVLLDYPFTLKNDFNLQFQENIFYKNKVLELNGLKVLLAPKSKSYFRMWGYRDSDERNYYKELELIKHFPEWNFIVLDVEHLDKFDNIDNVLNISGETDILDCATICKYVDFGIVPDSGVMHLLGMMDIPTIALFGNVSEPEYRISKYKKVFPITTPTRKLNLISYKKEPYCHISNCWDGQVHNCMGEEHEKWCMKEISIDKILNIYDENIKGNLTNSSFISNPYNFKKYTIKPSSNLLNYKGISSSDNYFGDGIRGVKYIGQYGTSGYAIAAKGYIYDMHISGIPIEWVPIKHTDVELDDGCMYTTMVRSRIDKIIDADIMIIHDPPDNWEKLFKEYRFSGVKKVIGYTVWETEFLPDKWISYMNADFIDEIWCPSTYNQEVFKKSGIIKNIRVVPHVWMGKILPKAEKSQFCVFYNISEYIERKGVDELLVSFCEEFNKEDKVELVLKTHYRYHSSLQSRNFILTRYKEIIEKYSNPPKINLLLNHLTEEEILELHSYGDCYYAPCKSEGFGLPIYDAYNYGNGVIVTGYSGYMDFLGKRNKWLIDYRLGKVENMEEFSDAYSGSKQQWAIPDMEHAKSLLRKYYEEWRKR